MINVQKVGRDTVENVQRKRIFASFLLVKVSAGGYAILGCHSPYLLTHRERTITGVLGKKLNMVKALQVAHRHGRKVPTQQDMYKAEPITFNKIDTIDVSRTTPYDIYVYNI